MWRRPLGKGFSAIVADSGRLYTMYREGDEEIVVALRVDTGQTVWEHRYNAKAHRRQTGKYGHGPNATPLILGDRLVAIGFTGIMHCLNLKSGRPVWSHDLVKDFGSKVQYYGYSNSPIPFRDTIITLVGGEKYGVIALNPDTGSLVWTSPPTDIGRHFFG